MTLIKAGALILLLAIGVVIAGLALGVLTGSTEEEGMMAPQTDVVVEATATPVLDAPPAASEASTASMDRSELTPETAIPFEQASTPTQVETATFALG